ncbi:MAG: YfiR family protein [Acidobacteria bacterium]|nr:YfiR family protein [Acidobacteriota bacterium]
MNELISTRTISRRRCLRGITAWLALILLIAIPLPEAARAQVSAQNSDEALAYEVKASMMYHFLSFVQWPEDRDSAPFVVGVLGRDPFGPILEKTFAGKTVQNREIQIRRFAELSELEPCHILFVSRSERLRMSNIAEAARDMGILTVGDMERFAETGGMIGFKIESGKVRFEINLDVAKQAGLEISSRLLRLATVRGQSAASGRN